MQSCLLTSLFTYAVASEEKVQEFQHKRHGSDMSLKGRVSKLGKKEDVREDGGDEYPAHKFSDKVVDSDC